MVFRKSYRKKRKRKSRKKKRTRRRRKLNSRRKVRKHRGGQIHQLPKTKQELIIFANTKRNNIEEIISGFREEGWTNIPDSDKLIKGLEKQDTAKVRTFLQNWNKIADILSSTQRGGRRKSRKRKGGEDNNNNNKNNNNNNDYEAWSSCWRNCIIGATGASAVVIVGAGYYAMASSAAAGATSAAGGAVNATAAAVATGNVTAVGGLIWTGLSNLAGAALAPLVTAGAVASFIAEPAVLTSVFIQVEAVCLCAKKQKCPEYKKRCKTKKGKADLIFDTAKKLNIFKAGESGKLKETRVGIAIMWRLNKEFQKDPTAEKEERWEKAGTGHRLGGEGRYRPLPSGLESRLRAAKAMNRKAAAAKAAGGGESKQRPLQRFPSNIM